MMKHVPFLAQDVFTVNVKVPRISLIVYIIKKKLHVHYKRL